MGTSIEIIQLFLLSARENGSVVVTNKIGSVDNFTEVLDIIS